MQKARRQPFPLIGHRPSTVCKLMVSGSISLPYQGFFSPFPHGTSSLSVINESLALEGGPPRFKPGFTCPVLLRCRSCVLSLLPTGLSPCVVPLSSGVQLEIAHFFDRSYNPEAYRPRFGLFPLRSPLLGESHFDFSSSAY